jgi:hypothetical protein
VLGELLQHVLLAQGQYCSMLCRGTRVAAGQLQRFSRLLVDAAYPQPISLAEAVVSVAVSIN